MLRLTARNFKIETCDRKLPVVVMFYALWCGKCAMMKPIVEDIEKKYAGHVKFCGVDIEESPELADDFSSDIVPTFVFFKGGRAIGFLQGIISQEVFEERMERIFR